MKYTDEEIQNKFSNTDFDPTGIRQQRVLAKIYAKSKQRSFGMRKYFYVAAIAAAVFTAIIILPRDTVKTNNLIVTQQQEATPHNKFKVEEISLLDAYAPIAVEYSQDIAEVKQMAPLIFSEPSSVSKFSKSYNDMKDERYKNFEDNSFKSAKSDPLSTFSADVDTASYGIAMSKINQGVVPTQEMIRTEEFINYFSYNYPAPTDNAPIKITTELTDYPWNKEHRLLKIGVKAKDIKTDDLPPSNLVFLIDTSGSMWQDNRLPLIIKSIKLLIEKLRPQDSISIITYAGSDKVWIEGATSKNKAKLYEILDSLQAYGATNGIDAINTAYKIAKKHFKKNGNNRIILATDGDFNVGISSPDALGKKIEEHRKSGVFLSVFGFGMGNYKDDTAMTLANKGNGNYAYIESLMDAKKSVVDEFGSTFFTVAKDVKFQVEFNPALVDSYRLIGYEKRKLNNEDFNDDAKDAGEMGAGHTVTVLYEIIPTGAKDAKKLVDDLKYTQPATGNTQELATVKMRYKEPKKDVSKLISQPVLANQYLPLEQTSDDTRFAAAVAAFADIAKDTPAAKGIKLDDVLAQAQAAKGNDEQGYRADFIKTAALYKALPKNN